MRTDTYRYCTWYCDLKRDPIPTCNVTLSGPRIGFAGVKAHPGPLGSSCCSHAASRLIVVPDVTGEIQSSMTCRSNGKMDEDWGWGSRIFWTCPMYPHVLLKSIKQNLKRGVVHGCTTTANHCISWNHTAYGTHPIFDGQSHGFTWFPVDFPWFSLTAAQYSAALVTMAVNEFRYLGTMDWFPMIIQPSEHLSSEVGATRRTWPLCRFGRFHRHLVWLIWSHGIATLMRTRGTSRWQPATERFKGRARKGGHYFSFWYATLYTQQLLDKMVVTKLATDHCW